MSADAFEMALVHDAFRRELHNAVELVGDVAPGDTTRASIVADHIAFMVLALHHHHAAEDAVI